jgi:hypothetical protein
VSKHLLTTYAKKVKSPPENAVLLLGAFEFLRSNSQFRDLLRNDIAGNDTREYGPSSGVFAIITLTSYLVTHASSVSTSRSLAYANLGLHVIFTLIDHDEMLEQLCEPTGKGIHVCRQASRFVSHLF